jgi:holo-[acyl-carrier protein] synthase
MIVGIGTDLVAIPRIAAMVERHGPRFLRHVYAPEEIALAPAARADTYYAGRWAAKEAVAKALGTGIGAECRWVEIVVLRDDNGAPRVDLHGVTLDAARSRGVNRVHVSISHDRDLATAFAVLESGTFS